MAKRMIDTEMWNDPKFSDDFTPEDKYFWLFLLTTRYGNLSGVFEISINQIANDLGYNKSSVENLIYRFEEVHKMIKYNTETKEMFIFNWYKYNWTKSPLFEKSLEKFFNQIKCIEFKEIVAKMYEGFKNGDTVSIPYYTIPISNTISITNKDKDIKDNNMIKEVIDIFNEITKRKFTYQSDKANTLIKARLKEGITLDDVRKVVKYKYDDWKDDDKMKEYIRPTTLFTGKFHDYLMNANVKEDDVPFDLDARYTV